MTDTETEREGFFLALASSFAAGAVLSAHEELGLLATAILFVICWVAALFVGYHAGIGRVEEDG